MPAALLSPDRRYRYLLTRRTGLGERIALFVVLNPSTADETHDDATIRRCVGYCRSWGYGWLYVCNLSPNRATDPRDLADAGDEPDHVRDCNLAILAAADIVIAAWGANGRRENRAGRVLEALARAGVRVNCLALTRDGDPGHPLRLRADLRPQPYGAAQS